MGVIEDPRNSNTVAVDDDGLLQTHTVSIDEATRASLDSGEYFLVCNGGNGHPTTVSGGYVLWMQNSSTSQSCLIQNISISSSVAGYWHLGVGGTVSSYDATATIKNLNLSSSKTAPVSAFRASTTAISFTTNPSKVTGGHIAANTKWIEELNGALVLGTNNSIGIMWTGSGVVAVGIQFYMKDKS